MNNEQLHRDIGRLEGRVDGIDARVASMQEKVDEMHELLMEARGGWKAMVAVGTLSSGLTAFAIKAFAWLKGAA